MCRLRSRLQGQAGLAHPAHTDDCEQTAGWVIQLFRQKGQLATSTDKGGWLERQVVRRRYWRAAQLLVEPRRFSLRLDPQVVLQAAAALLILRQCGVAASAQREQPHSLAMRRFIPGIDRQPAIS